MKETIKNWFQHWNITKSCVVGLVIAIIVVVFVCGVFGNNNENFWKKDKSQPVRVEYVVPEEVYELS